MTDFYDVQLKEQLLLQQKWEDDVDGDEGNVSVSVLSNRTSFSTRSLLLLTEMNLDNATTHHLLRFKQSN